MKVIIPLAGFGKRMRPHTWSKPKPLVNIAGKPVLGHVLDKLADLDVEVDELIFIVGWLGEQIEEYYTAAGYPYPARYVEQRELLGQAHAIWLAREALEGPALIIFVDTIFEADLCDLETSGLDGVLYVREVDDPRRFGVAILDDEGMVTRLVEKPAGMDNRLAVVGVYYVHDSERLIRAIEELMERNIQTKGEYYLADAFSLMIEEGARFGVREVSVWEDTGTPQAVLQTNRYLLEHGSDNGGKVAAYNSVIIPPVYIADSARVEHSIVGPYVTVAEHAVVRNSIVRDSIIGEAAYLDCTMLEGSLIGHEAVVRERARVLNVGDSSQVDLSPFDD
ncbi:MAG: sugar phosphate nucleotidyltransferase [Anaerolineae bacterium]|jgi:glucose-1-phosphate thymidylyltransferase|nr:sugar phosphate nucleotidyltransferase [Anaerolineae bacterium]MDX9830720.1 sugar phosphate nucleotidyltransferase [Anaerolineae bacterium]